MSFKIRRLFIFPEGCRIRAIRNKFTGLGYLRVAPGLF